MVRDEFQPNSGKYYAPIVEEGLIKKWWNNQLDILRDSAGVLDEPHEQEQFKRKHLDYYEYDPNNPKDEGMGYVVLFIILLITILVLD